MEASRSEELRGSGRWEAGEAKALELTSYPGGLEQDPFDSGC